MTVKKYVDTLIEMLKKNPEIENYEVIYSSDDEGNSYQKVHFTPTVMIADSLDNQHIQSKAPVLEGDKPNVLCIN
jgi:hypothetical protein